VRNVFIEGPPEKYELAKKLIEEIIAEVRLKLILSNNSSSKISLIWEMSIHSPVPTLL
jgi:hypothetical protein